MGPFARLAVVSIENKEDNGGLANVSYQVIIITLPSLPMFAIKR